MKVLFFAPHSAIWVHAFPEALAAEALAQLGHEVVYVTCGKVLQEQCVAMSAYGRDYRTSLEERQAVCAQCQANKTILRGKVRLKGYDLADMLLAEDRRDIDRLLAGLNDESYLDFEVDGVPVGRYALYELMLHRKKTDHRLSPDEWMEYKAAMRGALCALFAGRRILQRENPDRVVTYNSLYAVNRTFSSLAARRGAIPYFLHAGGNLSRRLQTLMVGRDYSFRFFRSLVSEWPRFSDRPCPARLVEQITDHFLVLFGGKSVFGYSPAVGSRTVDVRKTFSIDASQRLLVATLSSPDERAAGQTVGAVGPDDGFLFPKQIDWIRALVRFVESRPDLFLLIRVHPREFPNKREAVLSQNARLLTKLFEALPSNAKVNWPSDNLALYDIANYADAFLNAWSSAGKEMALLGIPVVAYEPQLLLYPAGLNYVGTTEADYYAKIDRALTDGWSLERSRTVFRWLAVEYGYALVDISDSYQQRENYSRSRGEALLHRVRARFDANYLQKRDCSRRSRHLRERERIEQTIRLGAATPLDRRVDYALPNSDAASEERAVRASLVRLGTALFGHLPEDSSGPLARRLAQLTL